MITYMRLLKIENGFVTYEYGKSKENLIGTVTIETANKNNCTFDFYQNSEIKKFCTSTAHTIAMIYKFINNNEFLKEYTYAC